MTKKYDEQDIKQLTDLEHVRLRPTIYVGDTTPRVITLPRVNSDAIDMVEYKVSLGYVVCIREIIDNCIDIIKHTGKGDTVWINYDEKRQKFVIKDNSVGVPIGKHKSGLPTPEVVFGSLRSGKNFDTNEFVIGMNGVGASLTNFFSTKFQVTIRRDGKTYRQIFKNAVPGTPEITKGNGATGTEIQFRLDNQYFYGWEPSEDFISHLVQILAMYNQDIKFKYNNKLVRSKGVKDFKVDGSVFKKGDNWELLILGTEDDEYNVFSGVNGIPLLYGGKHVDHVEGLILESVKKMIKGKETIYKNNILKGMTILFSITSIPNIGFDTQAKTRLITEDIGKYVSGMDAGIKAWLRQERTGWLEYILEQFERKNVANQLAKKKRKNGNKKSYYHAKTRNDREVYIVEGLSALATLLPARNDNQGCIPLRGKIINASTKGLAEVVKSDTVYSLIDMLDLKLGENNEKCNYDKIILATDADPDGLHIQSLLINLFYHLAPELLSRIYVLQSPLYVVESKGNYEVYFTKEQFKKAKIPKGADIRYNKGLGSLTMKEWKVMVDPKKRSLIQAVAADKKKTAKTFKRLFSTDSSHRKAWLKSKDRIYEI